jgi:hypothetical protein
MVPTAQPDRSLKESFAAARLYQHHRAPKPAGAHGGPTHAAAWAAARSRCGLYESGGVWAPKVRRMILLSASVSGWSIYEWLPRTARRVMSGQLVSPVLRVMVAHASLC